MSRNERIKEEIGILRIVFTILAATSISLLAWFSQSSQNLTWAFTFLCVVIFISMVSISFFIVKKIYALLDELEGL